MGVEIQGMAPLLEIFDMPASLAFYRDILGFELLESGGPPDDIGWVLLQHSGVQLMLNTAYELPDRPPAPDPARVAVHKDTCIYFGCPDVDGAYHYLKSKGVSLEPPSIAPYGMRQLYLLDPDGYNLCFQWPVK